jgi:hypothetical protein
VAINSNMKLKPSVVSIYWESKEIIYSDAPAIPHEIKGTRPASQRESISRLHQFRRR